MIAMAAMRPIDNEMRFEREPILIMCPPAQAKTSESSGPTAAHSIGIGEADRAASERNGEDSDKANRRSRQAAVFRQSGPAYQQQQDC